MKYFFWAIALNGFFPLFGFYNIGHKSLNSPTHIYSLDFRKAVGLIHEKVLISEIVSQFAKLKENGPCSYTCLCPFHSDSNPSMVLSDDKGLYHCFSCAAGGDAIQFVRELEHLTFREAIVRVLNIAGLNNSPQSRLAPGVTDLIFSSNELELLRRRTRIELALQKAAQFYSAKLLGDFRAGAARTHLINRRIRPQTAFKFQIGYAPSGGFFSVTSNLTKEGFHIDELVAAGLSVKSDIEQVTNFSSLKNTSRGTHFDRFRDRLMIPIRSSQGAVIAFGGRLLTSETPSKPKYLNSPETITFKKSHALFGFDLARKSIAEDKMVVIVEGYFDVIALHGVGIETAVGLMGTTLSKEQLEIALRASKGKIILLFDSDDAGQRATEKVIEQLSKLSTSKKSLDLRVARLPRINAYAHESQQPKDAAEFCIEAGSGASSMIRAAISNAVGWKQWQVDRIIFNGLREDTASDFESTARMSSLIPPVNLDVSHPSFASSIPSLVSAPDRLAQIATSLSVFLATLPDPSDRTILAYYCAERLAGGRSSMRLQLELDLLVCTNKNVETSKSDDNRVQSIVIQHPSRLLKTTENSATDFFGSSVALSHHESTGKKNSCPLDRKLIQCCDDSESQNNETLLFASRVKLSKSREKIKRNSKFEPIKLDSERIDIESEMPSHQSIEDQVSSFHADDAEILDLAKIENFFFRFEIENEHDEFKRNRKWNLNTWESCKVTRHSNFENLTFGSDDNRVVLGAEIELLAIFAKNAALRMSVKTAKTKIENITGSNLEFWVGPGHRELWSTMIEVDSSRQRVEGSNFLLLVRNALIRNNIPSCSLDNIVAAASMLNTFNELRGEHFIAAVAQVKFESCLKRQLMLLSQQSEFVAALDSIPFDIRKMAMLSSDQYLMAEVFEVEVQNGICFLSGIVEPSSEKENKYKFIFSANETIGKVLAEQRELRT